MTPCRGRSYDPRASTASFPRLAVVERLPAESLSLAQTTKIASHRKKLTQERDNPLDRRTELQAYDEKFRHCAEMAFTIG